MSPPSSASPPSVRLLAAAEALIRRTGLALSWLNLLMVLGTLGVVILRYAFDTGAVWLQESVMYLHALVFMLGMALTMQADEHVRVDIIYQRLSERGRCWVNLLGGLFLLLPVLGFIAWESIDYVALSWRVAERSQEAGGLPWVYWLKTLIPAMVTLLFLQGLIDAMKRIHYLRHGRYPSLSAAEPSVPTAGAPRA